MKKITKKKQILTTTLLFMGLLVGMLLLLVLSLDWPLYALVIWGLWVAFAHLEFMEVRRSKSHTGGRTTFHDFIYAYTCWWRRPKGRANFA